MFPALLLAVAFILFIGFAWGQVGQAADQRTQTQTAADAGSVAAGKQVRLEAVLSAVSSLPTPLSHLIDVGGAGGATTACDAADRNWSANRHRTTHLSCADLSVQRIGSNGVRVDLVGPSGELSPGPVTGNENTPVRVHSTVRVSFHRCPQVDGGGPAALVAARIVDQAALTLGVGPTGCGDGLGVGPGWGSVLGPLLGGDGGELPDDVADPIRSLNPIRLAEQSFRVEIVD
ncbi:MAG TPA: pilus assembly protein TadG-related protein [Actinomycetales bacterium]|nr:pilus assembly protein TadG-related protein [Actinomycetales bacterium]